MLRAFVIAVLLIASTSHVNSQTSPQEILLMSGKKIKAKIVSRDSIYMHYDLHKNSGKVKEGRKIDMERVFAVYNQDGEEEVIYYMDTALGNFFSVDEMRFYIQGEQDAMRTYKANWTFFIGIPIAVGAGLAASSSIFIFLVPAVTMVAWSIPKYKIKTSRISSPTLASEPAYVLGYEHAARTKRVSKSLVSGIVGTAIGFAIGQSAFK
ncbi:MAG: hypothetical protein GWP27_10420 [Bacteroidetes bacterium]|nr:hypothetical protein [Bacteroidota bacterium]